jgi:hypothetical protein
MMEVFYSEIINGIIAWLHKNAPRYTTYPIPVYLRILLVEMLGGRDFVHCGGCEEAVGVAENTI